MFFDILRGPVLVALGDFLARDANGEVSLLPAERVRNYVVLRVSADTSREEVKAAGHSAFERTSRAREVERSQANEEVPSPFFVREDNKGRAFLVSILPGGREKIY